MISHGASRTSSYLQTYELQRVVVWIDIMNTPPTTLAKSTIPTDSTLSSHDFAWFRIGIVAYHALAKSTRLRSANGKARQELGREAYGCNSDLHGLDMPQLRSTQCQFDEGLCATSSPESTVTVHCAAV